jgi:hypothetical protein
MIDLPRALFRGRYALAVARIERTGVPIDRASYDRLRRNWPALCLRLIISVDEQYGVYENGIFRHDRFGRCLAEHQVAWPRTPTGMYAVDKETFRRQALIHPHFAALRELRLTLAAMREFDLPIGSDDRVRCSIMPFASITGRNQPRVSEFIFALPKWARGLIRPPPGWGLAYIDFSAQEIGIAAALSGDERMADHYRSGDIYLAFAKAVGMAPVGATKESHPTARARAKALFIAIRHARRGARGRRRCCPRRSGRALEAPPANVWSVLALERAERHERHAHQQDAGRVRLAATHWPESESTLADELANAKRWRRDAAPRRHRRDGGRN